MSLRRLSFLLAALAFQLPAHGPVHEQIANVTAEIRNRPDDARLYLKRGELHRHHRDWTAAEADYARAARFEPSLAEVDLATGRMWVEAGQASRAQRPLERFLSKQPLHSEALALRAVVHELFGSPRSAALDYERAIESADSGSLELYLACARAWETAGELERALNGLEDATRRMGSLAVLQLAIIDLERKLRRWDSAVARVDRIAGQLERKETWLARRAEILAEAERYEEAQDTYHQALAAIHALPPRLRQTKAMTDLEQQVRAALKNRAEVTAATRRE